MIKILQVIGQLQAYWHRQSTGSKIGLGIGAFLIYAVSHGLLVKAGLIEPEPVRVSGGPVGASSERTTINTTSGPEPMLVVRRYLREHLNDWDSYDGLGFSPAEDVADYEGHLAWRVRHRYRAKNGFGGTVLNDQLFYYTSDGVYQVIDVK